MNTPIDRTPTLAPTLSSRGIAKAFTVGVSGMGTHCHATLHGQAQGPVHGFRITGMTTAGDVGTRHAIQNLGVISHDPRPVALAEVGVQIYSHTDVIVLGQGRAGRLRSSVTVRL